MIKKLTRSGNSVALILDKPVLDLVGIDPSMPIDISTDDGKRLILTPVTDAARRKKFQQALANGNRKYANALRKLAE
jgi:antitoxin component of MazEF toxin-antitoxin module